MLTCTQHPTGTLCARKPSNVMWPRYGEEPNAWPQPLADRQHTPPLPMIYTVKRWGQSEAKYPVEHPLPTSPHNSCMTLEPKETSGRLRHPAQGSWAVVRRHALARRRRSTPTLTLNIGSIRRFVAPPFPLQFNICYHAP